MSDLELASSWSLRQHYSDNLHPQMTPSRPLALGRHGIAICNGNTTVYDNVALLDMNPSRRSALDRDRPMCKRCERLAADRMGTVKR